MNSTIVHKLRAELLAAADPKVRESSERFFKEEVRHLGVTVPVATKIGKAVLKQAGALTKAETFSLCEELFKTGYQEEAIVACEWAYSRRKEFAIEDFTRFSVWIDSWITNWASCDTLCNHTVGTCVEMHPSCIGALIGWATSDNRWKRRAAAVSLIIPARNGLFLPEVFTIADALLSDTEDLVQKGYGWMLKAASEAHCQRVFDFVVARKATMPRTAYRYAIEKMPKELRERAMKK